MSWSSVTPASAVWPVGFPAGNGTRPCIAPSGCPMVSPRSPEGLLASAGVRQGGTQMVRRFWRAGGCSVWLVLAMALALAPRVAAQSVAVAQLSGTVLDESGGALPGVEVTVTQTDTG